MFYYLNLILTQTQLTIIHQFNQIIPPLYLPDTVQTHLTVAIRLYLAMTPIVLLPLVLVDNLRLNYLPVTELSDLVLVLRVVK